MKNLADMPNCNIQIYKLMNLLKYDLERIFDLCQYFKYNFFFSPATRKVKPKSYNGYLMFLVKKYHPVNMKIFLKMELFYAK